MRNLTAEEYDTIKNDINLLIDFCIKNNLVNDTFKERIKGLQIFVSDFKNYPNAKGKVERSNKVIELREDILNDEFTRRKIIFHEVGHLLFNYSLMSNDKISLVNNKILNVYNKSLKSYNPLLALTGFKMLQEYIMEKFSTLIIYNVLNKEIEVRHNAKGEISGNYSYDTTFNNNYGLIESFCDDFIYKTYDNVVDIFKDCLDSFYLELFDKYDDIDLFLFLEEMGELYNMFDKFTEKQVVPKEETIVLVVEKLKSISLNARLKENKKKEDLYHI